MSGIRIVREILADNVTVTGMVPESRIKAMPLPQSITPPCIGISQISSVDRNIIKEGTKVRVSDRVQVMVYAADYVSKKTIIDAIRKALRYKIGDYGGTTKTVVLTDGKGPDLFDAESQLFMEAQDFLVTYNESTT